MPSDKLCVFGCVTTGVTIHRFPNPVIFPERFKTWVELAGDTLLGLTDEQIFKSKKVCDRHFMEIHKNRNKRLSALAVPVLHIHRPSTITVLEPSEPSANLPSDLPSTSQQLTDRSTTVAALQHTDQTGPIVTLQSNLPSTSQHLTDQSTTVAAFQYTDQTGPIVNLQSNLPSTSQQLTDQSTTVAAFQYTDQTGPIVNLQSNLPSTSQQLTDQSTTVAAFQYTDQTGPIVNLQSNLPSTSQQLTDQSTTVAALQYTDQTGPIVNLQSNLPSTSQQLTDQSTTVAAFQYTDQTGPIVNLQSNLLSTSQQLTDRSTTAAALQHTDQTGPIINLQSNLPRRLQRHTGIRKNSPSFNYNAMQKQIRRLRIEISRLKKRSKNYKTRLSDAEKLSQKKSFENITKKMSLPCKLFIGMQVRESSKKPKGHRFTTEEKILSMALYKRSPKSYSLLTKCFKLPSPKSLKNLLGKIKIEPGINKLLFKQLKQTVNKLSDDDRLCTLIFDEMSIQPQVHYNATRDELKGFTTIGQSMIADHALVFMVRGVKTKYKQPVAYYFTQNLNKLLLKEVIKEVIKNIKNTGLKILATICDQSMVNVGAIESLINDSKIVYLKQGKTWRNDVIIIEKLKIIPLYDTPHLFKGIRNNLITKDLKYIDIEDKKEKIVKWEYFQEIYEADKSYGELRLLPNITEEHVNSQKINKMKVKTATQLFSQSMASAIKHLFDAGKVSSDCLNLIPFLLLFDKLFDSMNSSTFSVQNGKIYRAGVRNNSPHHELWTQAIKFLKSTKFIERKVIGNKIRLTEKDVPSIKNLIKTIEGLQAIWKILHNKYEFDVMFCRNFNQDPIENYFGCIRSLGVRNVSPNTIGFEGAYKALLLSNFCSSHSLKANCEDDMNAFLQSLDFMLTETETKEKEIVTAEVEIPINEEMLYYNNENIEGMDSKHYVCGWVLKKCCQKLRIGGCMKCKQNLFAAADESLNSSFIKSKEYANKKWLCYPSNKAVECFIEIQNITTGCLIRNIQINNLKKNITQFTDIFVNFTVFDCDAHRLNFIKLFQDFAINVIIYSWCRSVNRILCGKISYDGDDEIKNYAKAYYIKHKYNKNKK